MVEFDEKYIGDYLSSLVVAKFGSKRDVGNALASLIGTTPESTRGIVTSYCNGNIRFKKGNHIKLGKVGTLERLALFYELLELEIDDPLVQYTTKINVGFKYPPQSKPDEVKMYNVSFADDKYVLDEKQWESLKNIAALYDKLNKK